MKWHNSLAKDKRGSNGLAHSIYLLVKGRLILYRGKFG
jgi:hypothetical protein